LYDNMRGLYPNRKIKKDIDEASDTYDNDWLKVVANNNGNVWNFISGFLRLIHY
jgi:hypothetical protein